MSLERDIQAYGLSQGLDVVAIGPAAPYVRAQRVLEERRAAGMYPAFTERDIALRCDPQRLLPGARSVIAGGISYLTSHRPRGSAVGRPPGRPRGTLSRYAWGRDYHGILKERLQAVAEYARERLGPHVEYAVYVDTGPPVDREVAAEAGLGWFGKNAMLYAPGVGSWIFIGTIFLTASLTPDPRVSLDCGDCTRCLDACPTGAIVAPYTVDPHRCVSHLTQMPGMIPEDLRDNMGLRVFGCDVCQQVCPWNEDVRVADRPEFQPLPGVGPEPDLIDWLHMTKKEFRETIGPTPMAWRGKKTIQRNAAIALGNSRNPAAIPALTRALVEDPKPVVRQAAAWALGKIGGPEAARVLDEALKREQDAAVRAEIVSARERAGTQRPRRPGESGPRYRAPRSGARSGGSRGAASADPAR